MHERLNPYRQPIALIAIFQGVTVVIAHALGHLGESMVVDSSGEVEWDAPALTSFFSHHGLWLLLVPALWTGIALYKVHSTTSTRFPIVAWLFFGAALAVAFGFLGFMAYRLGFGCRMGM